MADLLALSRAVIDEGKGADQVGPINRINHELSELRPDVAVGALAEGDVEHPITGAERQT